MRARSWRTVIALAMTAAVVAAVPPLVTAGGADGPRGPRGSRLQQELGLTDQQVQTLRDIHRRHAEAQRQAGQGLVQARNELRRLVLSGTDDAQVQAKQAEVERLLSRTVQARVDALKELRPVLTPEQLEKYSEIAEQPRRGHGHRHRPGGAGSQS
jgi:Spy/CpxP family protein refolding chaperone